MTSQALINDLSLDDLPQSASQADAAHLDRLGSEDSNQRLLASVRALYPAHQQEAFMRLQAKVENLLQELQAVQSS